MTLGEKLKQARLQKGLSQSQVCGDFITRNMLSQLEHDLASPSLKTLEYLSAVLDAPISWLVGENPNAQSSDPLEPARTAFQDGQYEVCLSMLQPVSELSQEGRLLFCRSMRMTGKKAFQLGNIAKAKELALQVLQEIPDSFYCEATDEAAACLLLLQCQMVLKEDYSSTLQAVQQTCALLPCRQELQLLEAYSFWKDSRFHDAAQALEHMEESKGANSCCYNLMRGTVLCSLGQYQEALDYLQQAEASPDFPRPYLSELYYQSEQCYRELEDFKMAYHYASLRLKER